MEWVVVLIDFSTESLNAWNTAKNIALKNKQKGINKKLFLLHFIDNCSDVSFSFKGEKLTGNYNQEDLKPKTKDAENKINVLINNTNAEGIEASGRVVESSQTALPAFLFEQPIDLILMGKRHSSLTGVKGAIGTNSFSTSEWLQEITRSLNVPILLVNETAEISGPGNIVINYSPEMDCSSELIERLKWLQEVFDLRIHILKVCTPPVKEDLDLLRFDMYSWADANKFVNYTLNTRSGPREEDVIAEFAEDTQSEIIVLPAKTESGIPSLLNGSYAEDTIFSNKAVLTVY